nr:hypothetical protein CFP56_54969 [Quercus suber]POF24047.1 hypothetical protein CFP56_54983 [Quercus suber]
MIIARYVANLTCPQKRTLHHFHMRTETLRDYEYRGPENECHVSHGGNGHPSNIKLYMGCDLIPSLLEEHVAEVHRDYQIPSPERLQHSRNLLPNICFHIANAKSFLCIMRRIGDSFLRPKK